MSKRKRKENADLDGIAYKKTKISAATPISSSLQAASPERLQTTPADADLQCLCIRNLPANTRKADLKTFLRPFGPFTIKAIQLERTDAASSFAVISLSKDSARNLVQTKNGSPFLGRPLQIAVSALGEAEKLEDCLESANKPDDRTGRLRSVYNLDMTAVGKAAATEIGVASSQFVDPFDSTTGVKLALAETAQIARLRRYLAEEGIDLSVMETPTSERSRTTLLIKNIPAGFTQQSLVSFFQARAPVKRCIIPPGSHFAMLELPSADDCDAAFKSLAYRKLGNGILHVDRAPAGIWTQNSERALHSPHANVTMPAGKLVIDNVSAGTQPMTLESHFRSCPGYQRITIQRADPPSSESAVGKKTTQPGKITAIVVHFASQSEADEAKQTMPLDILDQVAIPTAGKASSTMIIKNLPFEASKRDLRNLLQ